MMRRPGIVGETLVAGAKVSAIARSNGLDPSQLFAWRRKAKGSRVVESWSRLSEQKIRVDKWSHC
jgi:transposase